MGWDDVIVALDICELVTFPLIASSTKDPWFVVDETEFIDGVGEGDGVGAGVGVAVEVAVGIGLDVGAEVGFGVSIVVGVVVAV